MISDSETLEYVKNNVICWNQSRKHAYSSSSAGVLIRACAIRFFMLQQVMIISLLDTGLLFLLVLFTLMTRSPIVCFTLKCWCMAAVVNVKIQATERGNANTCQSLKSFSFLPYWGTLHGSEWVTFCGITTESCSGNSALFNLFGPKLNVSCKATCYSLSFLLVWAIFAFPCQFRLNS